MPRKIEISHRTIIFIFLFVMGIWLLYFVRDIILEFFLALLITAVLDPVVSKLSAKGVNRSLAVIFIYIVLLAVIGLAIAAIVPPLVEQTASFINNLPKFLTNLGAPALLSERLVEQVFTQLGALPGKIATATISVFSNFIGILTVLVFAFYLLSQRENLDGQISYYFGDKRTKEIKNTINIIEDRLGGWARAQLSLMIIVGIANYIGLSLLSIPFSLPLAILAGLLELVPYIGPTIAAIPAIIIGFGISPVIGFATIALAFLIQQLENYVLVPNIMQKNAGVNPIVTLIALAVGGRLAGVVGLIIAIPVFIIIEIIIRQYFSKPSTNPSL